MEETRRDDQEMDRQLAVSLGKERAKTRDARLTRALTMRQDGKTYAEIGRDLGITVRQAQLDVQRALLEHGKREAVEELRLMEDARLDVALGAIMPQVREGNLLAVDRMVRLTARRARLMGLDRPPQTKDDAGEQTMTVRVEYADADCGGW